MHPDIRRHSGPLPGTHISLEIEKHSGSEEVNQVGVANFGWVLRCIWIPRGFQWKDGSLDEVDILLKLFVVLLKRRCLVSRRFSSLQLRLHLVVIADKLGEGAEECRRLASPVRSGL